MRHVLILVFVAILLLLQVRFWHSEQGLPALIQAHRQIASFESMNAKLEQRNQAMQKEIKDLKQGIEAVEARARSELGMVKKDEIFYRILDDKKEQLPNHEQ